MGECVCDNWPFSPVRAHEELRFQGSSSSVQSKHRPRWGREQTNGNVLIACGDCSPRHLVIYMCSSCLIVCQAPKGST